ncbi:probable palmitoyltransferase ZDHHC24 [Oppia nitens]|uniref:probable palmitoyltransferase ZDHHC24 n=1 Tax=Oppia nitens TaxID=1686743 RepID=UPI0023DCE22F|nr:probable palmitoyltransferase ZDHHC24 [Oppia nitens]
MGRHYRRPVPKTVADAFGIGFLVFMVFATFVFEVKVVLPHIHTIDITVQYFHIIVGLFITFNIMSNFLWLITTPISTAGLLMPSLLKPNWRFCAICEGNSPPRSYHCQICDECVLKRDHHCVFSGCCIGYKNFRYYYGLLLWVAIGGLYATVLNQFFIWQALGGLTYVTVFTHIFPFPFWLFGYISLKCFCYTFLSVINFIGFMFATGLLYYHSVLMVNNQTTYERNNGINQYSLGNWRTNVCENLGPNWLAAILLSPMVKSPLPRNGCDYPTLKDNLINSNKSK